MNDARTVAILIAAALAFASATASAKEESREKVIIIERESSTTAYDWEMDGRISVSCSGDTCRGYYTLPTSGTQQILGAILRVQRPDTSIAIAGCISKVNVMSTLVLAADAASANDSNSPTVYRNCRVPAPGSIVEAEFHRNTVKLFWHFEGHKGESETYGLVGFLRPMPNLENLPEVSIPSSGAAVTPVELVTPGPISARRVPSPVASKPSDWPEGPASFLKIPFGKPLRDTVPECPLVNEGGSVSYHSADSKGLCFEQDAGRYRIRNCPAFESVFVRELNGNVEYVSVVFKPEASNNIASSLVERFGAPNAQSSTPVQSRAGTVSIDHLWVWNGTRASIYFDSIGYAADAGNILAYTSLFGEYLAKSGTQAKDTLRNDF